VVVSPRGSETKSLGLNGVKAYVSYVDASQVVGAK